MVWRVLWLALVFVAFYPCESQAQERYAPEPELVERFETNFAQTHDRGLYFRTSLGLAYAPTQVLPTLVGQETPSSWKLGQEFSLGFYPTTQLALHVSQWGSLGATQGEVAAGLGITYYFAEQSNWMISAMLGPMSFYDEAPDVRFLEQWGLAGEVLFGTGWWIASDWNLGLGVVAGAHHGDLDQDGLTSAGWHTGLRVVLGLN